MQIQSVNNQNSSNSFKAQLTIQGRTKGISRKLLSELMQRAEYIGTAKDKIVLQFEKEKKILLSNPQIKPTMLGAILRSRVIKAISDIGGQQYRHDFSYHNKDKKFNENDYLSEKMQTFMDELFLITDGT